MHLLVIQHCPVTPAGLVGRIAEERGAELRTVFPHQGEKLPANGADMDGLIVLGGPMHAGDDIGYPAFVDIMALIRDCHERAVPVLGICLGSQLIARAFGQRVYRFGGLEVGYPAVYLTEAAKSDPLLSGLAAEQRIMQMHEDSFDLPPEAVLLMQNEVCANQGFRIGMTTYGFQFHPEVTLQEARSFPRDCWASMSRHFGNRAPAQEARALREADLYFDQGAAFCRIMTDRWLDLVAKRPLTSQAYVARTDGERRRA
ncbi:type 1 glutamine amidotransferase [Dongia soli]|uniref:Type 1 glutamine amidotransferase n=1 Tax=Dongia soli TaxID=600628 RepID=A0ABU5EC99_9PROT|nr:type 1 glutamine amidotransferase [Dongia soli]MDY0883922.1 type 1 glutamine amidotransferase [Dongia soli]